MKKLFLLLIVMAMPLNIMAWDWNCCNFDWGCGWDLEFRAAAFRPSDKHFRHHYGKWTAEYQFEVAKQICDDTYAFVNVGWMSRKRHRDNFFSSSFDVFSSSFDGGGRNRIRVIPISFGLKQKFCITPCFKFYLGLGANYAWVRFRQGNRRSNGRWGGIVKTGFEYRFWECVFLDVFADYVFSGRHNNRRSFSSFSSSFLTNDRVRLSGWKLGAGVGVHF